MKYKLVIEYDSETRKITVTDPDGSTTASGCMVLIGNSPEEGTCLNSTMGDMRSVAEAFACLAGDENPRSRRVMAHIQERMHRKHITATEALEKFGADVCTCTGDAGCVCKKGKTFH